MLTMLAACGGGGASSDNPALSISAGDDEQAYLGDTLTLAITSNRQLAEARNSSGCAVE